MAEMTGSFECTCGRDLFRADGTTSVQCDCGREWAVKQKSEKMTLEQAAALCVRVGHALRTSQPIKDRLTTGNMLMQAALCISDKIKERADNG